MSAFDPLRTFSINSYPPVMNRLAQATGWTILAGLALILMMAFNLTGNCEPLAKCGPMIRNASLLVLGLSAALLIHLSVRFAKGRWR